MGYQLTYWNKRGRGEQVRLMLAELGEQWEEVHVGGESFVALQKQGPSRLTFGSVPMLEDGDLFLCQGPVILGYLARKHGLVNAEDLATAARADEIALGAEDLRIAYFSLFGGDAADKQKKFVESSWRERWLPALSGLLEIGSSGYFVGDSVTHADIAMWDVLDSITTWVSGAILDEFPRVERFYAAIKDRPNIAAYLQSERRPNG